jgi:hypothetical protein
MDIDGVLLVLAARDHSVWSSALDKIVGIVTAAVFAGLGLLLYPLRRRLEAPRRRDEARRALLSWIEETDRVYDKIAWMAAERITDQSSASEVLPELPMPVERLADVDERVRHYARELDSALRGASYVVAARDISPSALNNAAQAVGQARGKLDFSLKHPLKRGEDRLPAASSWFGDNDLPAGRSEEGSG